jgi:two-component system, OmpR family, phosphate regulon sensor histidine kinase PhoR
MFERKSLKWPILLAVTMIVLLVLLAVAWVLINIFQADWTLLSIGSAMFACVVLGVVLYLVLSIQQINLNRRQSNFIDSVTHELKSPIASLKLYLQTLNRRPVPDAQRQQFYAAMLEDVDRLDLLISQLLDVARLSHQASEKPLPPQEVRIDELIRWLVKEQLNRHPTDPNAIKLDLCPATVFGLPVDLEILFRNLIDNAFKYAGKPPQIAIQLKYLGGENTILAVIEDNGPGIPRNLRRRVFGRFFRIGNELERQKTGTGLGLFLARTVVKRLRGKIAIVDPQLAPGTRFEIRLPASGIL